MVENQTDHAHVKIDGQALMLLHIAAAFLFDWLAPFPALIPGPMRWFGILLSLGGLMLGFMAVRRFGRANTTLDPHGSVTTIVINGPYRFSRNPIYLGFVCILAGLPLALGTYWGAILCPVLVLLLDLLVIRYEEAYLEKKFGKVYMDYKSRVRRWL